MSSPAMSGDGIVFDLDHKLSQLCRQVEEAVAVALMSSVDPLLRDLIVLDVTPLRGAARLRVQVSPNVGDPVDDVAFDALERAVDRARGYLRAEVAASVHRKRAPDLEVEIIPPELAFGRD